MTTADLIALAILACIAVWQGWKATEGSANPPHDTRRPHLW